MKRRDQRLAAAIRHLTEAQRAIRAAMDDNERLGRRDQFDAMELARATDAAADGIRRIGYARRVNGYGQPRSHHS